MNTNLPHISTSPFSFALKMIYLWLFLFCAIPLMLVLLTSVLTPDAQKMATFPFTGANYQQLFSVLLLKVAYRSMWIALLTTLVCLLLAYPFSYLLIRSKYQSLLLLLIIIPFWTSSLIRTYAMVAILKFHGLLNTILIKLHLIHYPIQLLYTNTAVIFGMVYTLFPFMVLPIYSNMQRFDFRLIEAAQDLGANSVATFFRVLLPQTYHGILSGSLMVLLPAMTLFYIPNILGGARSVLLGNMIQDQFFVALNWPQGAAISVLLTCLLLLLAGFYRKPHPSEKDMHR